MIRALLSLALPALFLPWAFVGCSSFETTPVTRGPNGSAVLDSPAGPTCLVHGDPIELTQGYRMAALQPLPPDPELEALEAANPNFLPVEWSLEQSGIYRYPGPVEFCPTCQANIDRGLRADFEGGGRELPGAGPSSRVTRPVVIPGVGGGSLLRR